MNKEEVKKIIVEELKQIKVQFYNAKLKILNKDEVIRNILAKLPDNNFEVIAKGEVNSYDSYIDKDTGVIKITLFNPVNLKGEHLCEREINDYKFKEGKQIEIAIRVIPDKVNK